MSFPRYPKYKPSGVEWLGAVPEGWEVKPLKCNFQLFGGSTPKSENEAFWNGDIPWATPADLGNTESLYISDTQRKISADGLQSCATSLVPPNSIILSTRASIGALAITQTAMCTNQGCKSLVPSARVSAKYFGRLLSVCSVELSIRGKGTTFLELSADELARFKTPIPPLPEQTAIAEFLDRETGKIDGLVAEQRRLMELLKEKRQAVISHAVTKGLNPHAPMKPSGIEWLGDVPEHWNVSPIGLLCDSLSYGFTNPMPTADEGPFMLTANDVDYGRVRYESARRTTYEAYDKLLTGKSRPKEGDVLITKDGTLGRVALHQAHDACINQSVASLRVKAATLRPAFMATCLLAGLYQRRMIFEAGGTTIKHIYISRLAKMPIAYPSHAEQDCVLAFLEQELAKFDTLTAEAQRAIDLLQERRTALISAAVTGQIDVRGLAKHPFTIQYDGTAS